MMLKVVRLLRAYVNGVLYSFAVTDNNSTDVAYSRGPSAAAELLVEQTNTLKYVKLQTSDVQERLTVAEQVTAATQQSALQESDNSKQPHRKLTPEQQPTTDTGKPIDSCAVQYPLNGTIYDYVFNLAYIKIGNWDNL